MRRVLSALVVALVLAIALEAQVIPPQQTITTQDAGTACSLPKTCATWNIGGFPTVAMQVTGTFTGTLTFEATADGQTYFGVSVVNLATGGLVSSTTTTGQFTFANTGLVTFRARATAAVTGGANVTLTKGVAMSAFKAPAGSSLTLSPTLFAALGTPADGKEVYCSDCTVTTPATCPGTQASCVCVGGGTGAFARRVAGAWYCTF